MVRRVGFAVLLALLVTVASLGPPGIAASEYTLTVEGSVTGPPKQVTVEGTTHTVRSVAAVERGGSVTANVDAPDETYDLYLYNTDRQIVKNRRMDGSGSVTFATDRLDVGSYVLAVSGPDGEFRDIQPVVVEGYTVSQSAPDTVARGDGGTVAVSLSEIDSSPDPSRVEVVLMEWSSLVARLDATETGGTYEATLPETLDTATYTYYAAARGPDTVNGERELIALGSKASFTVEAAQTTQSTTGGGSTGEQSTTDAPTTSKPSTSTSSQTTTATDEVTTTVATTAGTTATEETTSSPTTQSTTDGEGTTSVVITPATGTTETSTSQQTLPSDGVTILAMLVLATALALRRR